jgi:hypothetical protein
MKIVAFGCSYTYGHGLLDCLQEDKITQGSEPSTLAFPSLVAKKLNCEVINLGKSGNSNKEIWNDVVNFNFQKDDIAIITWTYFSRFCIIKSDSIRRINPWNNKEKLYYMNYSNRHDMVLDFHCRSNHINLYLNNIGIRNYNFVVEEQENNIPKWNKSVILGLFKKIDQANDDCHPGILSHTKFSEEIYKIISG